MLKPTEKKEKFRQSLRKFIILPTYIDSIFVESNLSGLSITKQVSRCRFENILAVFAAEMTRISRNLSPVTEKNDRDQTSHGHGHRQKIVRDRA